MTSLFEASASVSTPSKKRKEMKLKKRRPTLESTVVDGTAIARLLQAAKEGDIEKTKEVLAKAQKEEKLGELEPSILQALHWAAKQDNMDMVAMLFSFVDDPHLILRAIHSMCRFQRLEMVNLVLKSQKLTKAHLNLEGVKLTGGVKLPLLVAVDSGNLEIVKLLLSYGALPEIKAEIMQSDIPLHRAVEKGYYDICVTLLKAGSDPNFRNMDGESPLHIAAWESSSKIVRLLIENNSLPTKLDRMGRLPIWHALTKGRKANVKELLPFCSKKDNFIDHNGYTPLHAAADRGDRKAVRAVIGSDLVSINQMSRELSVIPGRTALAIACAREDNEMAQTLLELGADPNVVDTNGHAPLYTAVEKGATRIAKVLLDFKADPDIQNPNTPRWTPLIYACKSGQDQIVQLLLEKGAEIDKPDDFGRTPLFIACLGDQIKNGLPDYETVRLLLTHGANANIKNNNGETPLFTVSPKGITHSKIIELLAIHGSNPDEAKVGNDCALANIIRSVNQARKSVKKSTQVEITNRQVIYKELLRSAKLLISHPEANLDLPIDGASSTSILSYIVSKEIDVLVQHPKVRRILDFMWGSGSTEDDDLFTLLWNHFKSRRVYFVWTSLSFMAFFTLFTAVALLNSTRTDVYSYWFTESVKDRFIYEEFPYIPGENDFRKDFQGIDSEKEFWIWTQGPLLEGIFGDEDNTINRHDFLVTDVVMRQFRVGNNSCSFNEEEISHPTGCYARFSTGKEDKEPFGPGNRFVHTESTRPSFESFMNAYYPRDGGFVETLNATSEAEARQLLTDLQLDGWIDRKTTAVFVEFAVYNGNLNRFCIARISLEFINAGKIITFSSFETTKRNLYNDPQGRSLLALEIILLMTFVVFVISKLRSFYFSEGWGYIQDKWNIIDSCLIILIVLIVIIRLVSFTKLGEINFDSGENQFYALSEAAYWRFVENNIFAVASLFLGAGLLKYIRILPKCGIMIRVIAQMVYNVIVFLIIFLTTVASFGLSFHILIGTKMHDFRNWGYSMMTLFRMIIGDFNWAELEAQDQSLVIFLFFAYIGITVILLLNLLIAMLNQSYEDVVAKAKSEYSVERAQLILSLQYGRSKSYEMEGEDLEMKVVEKKFRTTALNMNEGKSEENLLDGVDIDTDDEDVDQQAPSSKEEETEVEDKDKPLTAQKMTEMMASMLRVQQEMFKQAMEDHRGSITREIQQQTLELAAEQTAKMNHFMDRIENLIPQTEFEYVYR